MSAPTVSMLLIAKDECANVRPCLASFGDSVDEIVFVDTGSRDGTVAEVRRFADERGWRDSLTVGRFKWVDDYASARNYAHSLASGDWHCWTDCDDRVIGADRLRGLAANADPSTAAFVARYRYGDSSGAWLWPPRLVRPDAGEWIYRTYEVWNLHDEGSSQLAVTFDVTWEHRRRDWSSSLARELRILRRWEREEQPTHPVVLMANAMHLVRRGEPGAQALLRRLLRRKLKPADRWLHGRGAVMLGEILAEGGEISEAWRLAMCALESATAAGYREDVNRARLLLANLACWDRDYEQVLRWTTMALEHPMGCWMTFPVCELHVGAACRLGRPEDARDGVQRAVAMSNEDPRLRRLWRQLQQACEEAQGRLAIRVPSLASFLTA